MSIVGIRTIADIRERIVINCQTVKGPSIVFIMASCITKKTIPTTMHIMPCSGPDSLFNNGALIAGSALIHIRIGIFLMAILVGQDDL